MKHKHIKGIDLFTFEHFEQTGLVKHCFSGKMGRGFRSTRTAAGRFAKKAGFDRSKLVFTNQVHGITVCRANDTDTARAGGIDGLVSSNRRDVLVTLHADCVPLFFLDPVQRAIGLAHAGWRGTVEGMAVAAVAAMIMYEGAKPENMLAGIGPSIGPCCFEVDLPVAEAFLQAFPHMCSLIAPQANSSKKYNINLWEMNRRALVEAGIPAENIESANLCTACNPSLFYSHRRQGKNRGSMAAFMTLLGEK